MLLMDFPGGIWLVTVKETAGQSCCQWLVTKVEVDPRDFGCGAHSVLVHELPMVLVERNLT